MAGAHDSLRAATLARTSNAIGRARSRLVEAPRVPAAADDGAPASRPAGHGAAIAPGDVRTFIAGAGPIVNSGESG